MGDQGPQDCWRSVTVVPMAQFSQRSGRRKVKLVEFPPGTNFESVGNLHTAPAQSGTRQAITIQGSLKVERESVAGAVELVAVQRYAEMMQRRSGCSIRSIVATEDIPKVNRKGLCSAHCTPPQAAWTHSR
jgi:hypothetical protein